MNLTITGLHNYPSKQSVISKVVTTVKNASVFIPAQSCATVMATCTGSFSNYAVIEPLRNSDHLRIGVIAEATVVDTRAGTFPVRITNLSTEGVVIRGKTRIGIIYPIETVICSDAIDIDFKQVSMNEIRISPSDIKSNEDIRKTYLSEVDLSEFTGSEDQLEKIRTLLHKHSDIFAKDNLDVGDNKL